MLWMLIVCLLRGCVRPGWVILCICHIVCCDLSDSVFTQRQICPLFRPFSCFPDVFCIPHQTLHTSQYGHWTKKCNSRDIEQRSVTRVVKRSSKIRSSIYKFEFKFSFLAFAIRSVVVPQGRAFSKLHSCIVCISNAWLRALHRWPARWNTVT